MSQTASGPELENLDRLVIEATPANGTHSKPPDADESLPRRDFWLLPLVVILVLSVVLGASELIASRLFPERGHFSCGTNDTSGGRHLKPNCVTHYKNAEGPDVEYRFNECGYRSSKPCGPKPPGALRIALIGTSVTMGLYVPSDETFAVRTERALSQICQRPVEVQNLGAIMNMASQPEVVDEAMGLSPDVIVLTVSPFDIQEAPAVRHSEQQTNSAKIKAAWYKFKLRIRNSRFALAAAHFALMDEQMLYQVFLSNGTSRDLMSSPPTPMGERRYSEFAGTLDRMMPRLTSTGTPVVVLAVPNRIAAAMVSNNSRVEGVDPWWFGRRISAMASERGGLPVDVTAKFAASPHAERLFYPVDNHPTGEAHAIIADALVERLTDGSIPQMSVCRASQP